MEASVCQIGSGIVIEAILLYKMTLDIRAYMCLLPQWYHNHRYNLQLYVLCAFWRKYYHCDWSRLIYFFKQKSNQWYLIDFKDWSWLWFVTNDQYYIIYARGISTMNPILRTPISKSAFNGTQWLIYSVKVKVGI